MLGKALEFVNIESTTEDNSPAVLDLLNSFVVKEETMANCAVDFADDVARDKNRRVWILRIPDYRQSSPRMGGS